MARPIAIAQIARARTQIGETELQILNVDQTRQSEAQRELREVVNGTLNLTRAWSAPLRVDR